MQSSTFETGLRNNEKTNVNELLTGSQRNRSAHCHFSAIVFSFNTPGRLSSSQILHIKIFLPRSIDCIELSLTSSTTLTLGDNKKYFRLCLSFDERIIRSTTTSELS